MVQNTAESTTINNLITAACFRLPNIELILTFLGWIASYAKILNIIQTPLTQSRAQAVALYASKLIDFMYENILSTSDML